MNKKIILSAMLLCLALTACQGRTTKEENKGPKVALIKMDAYMWWSTVENGARAAAAENGVNLICLAPETGNDRERQIQLVRDAVNQRIDALVLAPCDFTALARPVNQLKDRGIKCVIIDSGIDTKEIATFVATDNYQGGVKAARRLAEQIGGKGAVIIQQNTQNAASTESRAKGFKETMAKEFPEITIAMEQYTQGTIEEARQKTTDMLRTVPDVKGIFAVNHESSVGAYKALAASGLGDKVKMVGYDCDAVLAAGVEKGEIDALIVQQPYEIGYQGIISAVKAIKGEELPEFQPVPSLLVEKANIEEMKEKYASALGI